MNTEMLNFLRLPSFHWQTAWVLAECSQLAYQQAEAISHVTSRRWGFENSDFVDAADSQAFLVNDNEIAVLAFRGTESVGEWLGKLDVASVNTVRGKVHKGFNDAWTMLKPSVNAAIKRLPPSVNKIWLTGHNLGGAAAVIAAADLMDESKIAGVYTFGQPRVGDPFFKNIVENRYADLYVRFVNEDDLVTRLPPGYVHCGRLLRLFDSGQVQSELFESIRPDELPALTLDDLDSIKAEIESVEVAKRTIAKTESPFQESTESCVEGMIPSFADHKIAKYIAAIRRNIPNEDTEVSMESVRSSSVRSVTAAIGLESTAPREAIDESIAIPVLLRIRSDKWVAYPDLKVNSRLGTIVTANATASQIERLQRDPDIASIDVSRDAGHLECAVSVPFVGGDLVQVPLIDERGSNAIVGSIDSGIDVLHRAFLDGAGKSRILAVWNQKDPTGPSPKSFDPATYSQDYGTLYDQVAIQRFVDKIQTPSIDLRDPLVHGTHVASIAAGRKTGNFAGGIAPESRLALVIPHMHTAPGDPPSIGYSNSHVDALVFLRALAGKHNLPIAINVSLGMNAGAHDGMSTLEAAFDAVTGSGRDPGIAIVKSAGNERGFAGHAKIEVMEGGVSTLTWNSKNRFRIQDYIEVWYSGIDELEFVLISPDLLSRSAVVSAANTRAVSDLGGNRCSLELTANHPDNGDSLLAIRIRPDSLDILPGEWRLEVTGIKIFSTNGRVDAWVERDDKARAVMFTSGDNDEMTLSIPGTANTVITVAACEPKTPLRLFANSSFGPSRKLSPKPELVAPGENIIAALANDANNDVTTSLSGTSMAAPHVTGAIALAFSRRNKNAALPQLNAQQIRTALLKTLKNRTQNHNVGFGFGILNIEPFLKSLP